MNYINYYKQIFESVKDNSILLNKLLNEHNELNHISYHYFGKNESYDITKDKRKRKFSKIYFSNIKI